MTRACPQSRAGRDKTPRRRPSADHRSRISASRQPIGRRAVGNESVWLTVVRMEGTHAVISSWHWCGSWRSLTRWNGQGLHSITYSGRLFKFLQACRKSALSTESAGERSEMALCIVSMAVSVSSFRW